MAKESIVGPWAVEKLAHLRKYLHAYATIMSAPRQRGRFDGFHYIDAFAGPGIHELRQAKPPTEESEEQLWLEADEFIREQPEQRQYLAGSPRIALETRPPFTSCVFVERSSGRVTALQELAAEYGLARKIMIHQGDCRTFLQERVAHNAGIDWTRHRAVVFLDPFGMQVDWETIVGLANTKAVDVFINFPVGMAIQRLLRREPDQLRRQWLDRYFGSGEWFDEIYKRERRLFDDHESKIKNSSVALVKWYKGRLKAAFNYASNPVLIRNTRKKPLYYLIVASPKDVGVRIANDILKTGEVVR